MLGTLASRLASRVSGGERKILALGRAIMTRPAVMLLDEPTASLSPEMARVVLQDYLRALAGASVAVLLIEQSRQQASPIGCTSWWAGGCACPRRPRRSPAGRTLDGCSSVPMASPDRALSRAGLAAPQTGLTTPQAGPQRCARRPGR